MNVKYKMRTTIIITSIKCLIWILLNIGVNAILLHFGQNHFDNSGDDLNFLFILLNVLFFIVSSISFFLPFVQANSLNKNRDLEHVILLLFSLLNVGFVFYKYVMEWPYGTGTL